MNKKDILRKKIHQEIKSIINEGVIDPYLMVNEIAISLHGIKRDLEEIMNINLIPDEAAVNDIKIAYVNAKKSFEIMNKLLIRYQNMGVREDK